MLLLLVRTTAIADATTVPNPSSIQVCHAPQRVIVSRGQGCEGHHSHYAAFAVADAREVSQYQRLACVSRGIITLFESKLQYANERLSSPPR